MQHLIIEFALISLGAALVYEDCNSNPNKILHFEHGVITVDPLEIPGQETISVDVQILQDISGNHYDLELKIKKLALLDLTIPCVNNIGSCTYDLCEVLTPYRFNDTSTHCPLMVYETSPDFPCACPFKAGTYTLNPTTFEIPELSGLIASFSQGDYEIDAVIIDTTTGEEVACYHIEVSVGEGCKGFGCLIGKKRK